MKSQKFLVFKQMGDHTKSSEPSQFSFFFIEMTRQFFWSPSNIGFLFFEINPDKIILTCKKKVINSSSILNICELFL